MARTGTAEEHQAAQAAVVQFAVAPAVAVAWLHFFDVHDIKGSTPKLAAAIRAIVRRYGRASASAALTYYRNERRAAGVTGRAPSVPMPDLPTEQEIEATVEKVLHPVYGPPDETAEQNAQDALTSEVEQMVLDQGRRAVMDAVELDKEATAWARVTEPGACSFCRLLATRGAVYRSSATADFRAHTVKPDGSGGTCRCHAEPVFGHYEPTAQARQDLADYERIRDESGLKDNALLIEWRRHVEGRTVTQLESQLDDLRKQEDTEENRTKIALLERRIKRLRK